MTQPAHGKRDKIPVAAALGEKKKPGHIDLGPRCHCNFNPVRAGPARFLNQRFQNFVRGCAAEIVIRKDDFLSLLVSERDECLSQSSGVQFHVHNLNEGKDFLEKREPF